MIELLPHNRRCCIPRWSYDSYTLLSSYRLQVSQQMCLILMSTPPGFQAFDAELFEVLEEVGGGFALQSPWSSISEKVLNVERA